MTTFIVLSNSPKEATTIVQISAIFCLYYKPDTVGIFIIIGSSQFYKYAVLLLCDLLLLLFLKWLSIKLINHQFLNKEYTQAFADKMEKRCGVIS